MPSEKNCAFTARVVILLIAVLCGGVAPQRAPAQSWYRATLDTDRVERTHQNLLELEAEFAADQNDYARGRRKEFMKWARAVMPEIDREGNRLPVEELHAQESSVAEEKQAAEFAPRWRPISQSRISSVSQRRPVNKGLARLNRIHMSPSSKDTVYGATAHSGLWRSTDRGVTWEDLTADKVPVTQAWAACESPYNADVLLLGTQSAIYRSDDAGVTWSEATDATGRVRDIYFDPQTESRVYAAAQRGVFRSDDGGVTWTKVLDINANAMRVHPTASGVIYVSQVESGDARVWVSANGGDDFESHALPEAERSVGRTRLAVSAAAPDCVYLVTDNRADHGFGALYVSENRGADWRFAAQPQDGKPYTTDTPNVLGYSVSGDQPGGQLGFCFAFAVSQDNPDEMYVAGVCVWKSTDGGKTWINNAPWYPTRETVTRHVHADVHDIVARGNEVWVVHDGGVSYSTDKAKTFRDRTAGINALEILGFDANFHRPELMVHASMHVGSSFWDPRINDGWYSMGGADDNYCGFGIVDDQHVIHGAGYVFNRATLRAEGRPRNIATLSRKEPNGAIGLHTRNHQIVFQGVTKYNGTVDNNGSTLHRSVDFGETWTKVLDDDKHSDDGRGHNARPYAAKSRVVGCWGETNHLYYKNGGRIYESFDDGQTWEQVCDFNEDASDRQLRSRVYKSRVLDIAVDPRDDATLYITLRRLFDDHVVMRSTDAGRTWEDFSQGLPEAAGQANSIAVQRGANGAMYLGTHRGVYYRDDSLDGWTPYHKGLPISDVVRVVIDYKNNRLLAATFGRGIWIADLHKASQPHVRIAYNATRLAPGEALHLVDYSVLPFEPSKHAWLVTGPEAFESDEPRPQFELTQPGDYTVKITVYDADGVPHSEELPVPIRVE